MSSERQIAEMEQILNRHSQLIENLETLLTEFKSHQDDYQKLKNYYTSDAFMADFERANQGEFDHLNCGVLSEDAVFNLLTDQYQLAIRLLEIGTDMIKNH